MAAAAPAGLAAALTMSIAARPGLAAPADGTLSIQVENDYFSPDNRDRHYTNGVRIDWLPAPDLPEDRGAIERLARSLPFIGDPGSAERIGWSVGQSLFTPQNLKSGAPILNDRPYAGWLYAGLTLIKSTMSDPSAPRTLDESDTLEIDLGVVGRAAEGKAVQRDFHRWAFANEDPKGWNNQLKSEPGLLMSYDHKWRALRQVGAGGFGVDVTPIVGGDLGNVEIDASVGATVRAGYDLPIDYGPPRIRPGLSGSSFFLSDTAPGGDFGFYVFGGIEGRAVAHNIFLDGNTFAKSLNVPKKNWVADLQGGVAVMVHGVRLTATEVVRTQEFVGQHGTDAFGAISASFNF